MSNHTQDTLDTETNSYISIGDFNRSDIAVSGSISGVITAIRSDLSTKLDCETAYPVVSGAISSTAGLETSGDIKVIAAECKILSGNYFQTNEEKSLSVRNFSYKNSFLQAEIVVGHEDWGIACTGAKGYCILGITPSLKQLKLSGDVSLLADNQDKKYSWALSSGGDSETLEIESVNITTGVVTFKNALPSGITKYSTMTETKLVEMFDMDDNAIYCPRNPEIGNVIIHNFYANHAEGGSVKAIGKYAHAEGRNTIADMRYSHAEGDNNIAGRLAAHAEGQFTKAYGHYSHSEGSKTYVDNAATAGHAEGIQTSAFANYSHAEGESTKTSGIASHASGVKAYANENYSFAWNGISGTTYNSNGVGTFNINPVGGVNGFYIGDQKLSAALNASFADSLGNIFVHKDGTQDTGNIQLNGQSFDSKSSVVGNNCKVGGKYFEFTDADLTAKTFTLANATVAELNALKSALSKSGSLFFYSCDWYDNFDFVGNITAVDVTNKKITVDNIPTEYVYIDSKTGQETKNELDMSTGTRHIIWIPSNPELGTYTFGDDAAVADDSLVNTYAFAEGLSCYATYMGAHAEGQETRAAGKRSHAEGFRTKAGYAAHAEGRETMANAPQAHAEGKKSIASGDTSHAEGAYTLASAFASHAEGFQTSALAVDSHAEGYLTKAAGNYSHAAGKSCHILGNQSWGWNGKSATYEVNREGTFNINPKTDLNGFYIGNDDFIECVVKAIEQMTATQKNRVKTALGL